MLQLHICGNFFKILVVWITMQEVQAYKGIIHKRRGPSNHGNNKYKSIVCPSPNGLFPHPKDCSKYLNCVHNYAYVQSCGPGTLFNPQFSNCDHPWNFNCFDSFSAGPPTSTSTTTSTTSTTTKSSRPNKGLSFFGGLRKVVQKVGSGLKKIKKKLGGLVNGAKSEVQKTYHKVIKKDTESSFISSDPRALCLKPTGQFPYPKDCSKFVNCWGGRAFLSDCPAGLHFDASISNCGWPGNAICASRTLVSGRPSSSAPATKSIGVPFSGQSLRLRRGGAPYVGYLQAWLAGDWRLVVVTGDSWRAKDAICHSLGFTRGAHSETRGLVYGWPKKSDTFEKVLLCSPHEEDPLQCPLQLMSREKISKSLAGIRCHRNSVSECPPGWHRWGDKCYFVNTQLKASQSEAKVSCEKENGRLLSITSQEENDFVSYLVASSSRSETFHSGGLSFSLQGEQYWMWRGTDITSSNSFLFTKWWPGWEKKYDGEEDDEGVPNEFLHATPESTKAQCIHLQGRFPYPGIEEDQPAKYFFWKLGDCETNLNFVCERDPLPIGCIVGRGESYNGTANTTASGEPCLPWRSLGGSYRGLSQLRTLRENFCLNPDGDDLPWCFVAENRIEYCDIPRCPRPEPLKVEIEKPKCAYGSFPCQNGKCIYLEFVCDGQKDCSEGEDEEDCPDYSGLFRKHSGAKLKESQVEKWLRSPKPTCAIRCVQAKSFKCHSFNYEESSSTCVLNKNNAGSIGHLVKSDRWEYHERIDLAPDCTDFFNCSDFKCISGMKVCDGRRDCAEGEDERGCLDLSSFEVRLANGSGRHEGRVETKVGGDWGPVCDDMWGIEDGNVVCRQLGYTRGAKKTFTNSHFGNGNGNYTMDDLNCNGNEESLSSCDFGGWKKSDCDPNEAAGVTCYRDKDKCLPSEWECANRRCIEFIYYCDQIDDCGDNSDEQTTLCMSPIALRLSTSFDSPLERKGEISPNSVPRQEGRVEIRYKGIWGTVCDDDISLVEGHVICQMLGWKGAMEVLKNNSFGPGSGPIWIDGLKCQGIENSITECHHDRWGSTNCDHTEDLGVKCTNDLSLDLKIRSTTTTAPAVPSPLLNFLPSKCGIRFVDDNPKTLLATPKIVDGYIPVRGAQPWMAGIRRKTTGGSVHECGAFILTEDLIVTAAHCLWRYTISTYFLRTGDYNNEERDAFEKEWMLEHIIIHPNFDKGVLFNNDIALIKIKRKKGKGIKFNERVQPICLPSEDFSYPSGLNCSVAGWGTLSSTLGYSRILQSTLLPILPDSVCREDHVYGDTRISEGMFCAGYLEGGIDTCQGDSGGPLVCQIDGQYTAVGITSWGHGCARANKPGVYTRLTYYLNWIYNVTQQVLQ